MKIRSQLSYLRRKLISDALWGRLRRILLLSKRTEKVLGPLTYNQDGLASMHNCDFINDERFAKAYAAGKSTGSWGSSEIHWRAYLICWAAQKGLSVEGDFVECGVNRGGLARTVIEYTELDKSNRKFYLLDTFAGLDERYISDEERDLGRRAGGFEECFNAVQNTFAPYSNVVLVRGPVPETLPQVKSEKIAFLSIDMNCAPPEIAAVEYFWPTLSSGAVIVLDDYGWSGHIVQKHTFDRFAETHGVQVLSLPTGQGLIFKP